jgi:hypothetical protein
LKKLKPTGWWGDEQVDDTRTRVMNNWDKYTPDYNGDDHLSGFYQEPEDEKIEEDRPADWVRRYYVKHDIGLSLD